MGKNKHSKEVYLTIDQWNSMMDDLEYEDLDIQLNKTTVSLQYGQKYYAASLTGDKEDIANVGNIWNCFKKYCKEETFELENKENYGYKEVYDHNGKKHVLWDLRDPGGYNCVKTSKSKKWLVCYGYDVNSSYSYAMLKPMPDTSVEPRLNSYVREGEIGFYTSGGVTTEIGAYAEYIFPLKPSPFVKYVIVYYEKKRKAKTKEERDKWKAFLNIPTGMLQRHNIFMRLTILYYAREYIKQFIDNDTVYCNVDSIVSLRARDDLPLGDELGQFKQEHPGERFKFLTAGIYQWEKTCHYKGIPSCTITDIEHVDSWLDNLPYRLENRRLIKNEKEK